LRASDIAVVAVPLGLTGQIAQDVLAPGDYEGLVTDVGSVKGPVRAAFAGHERFVGGHPMAGKERSGFAAAEAGLFEGRKWVLCLDEETRLDDWITLAGLWTAIGAHVVPATAERHDAAVARVSHVEHLVAAAVVQLASDPLSRTLGAGSFRDATRVAQSPAHLFEGMVTGNGEQMALAWHELREILGSVSERLADDRRSYEGRTAEWFAAAGELRRSWPPEPGDAEEMRLTRGNLLQLGLEGGWVESAIDYEIAMVRRPRVQSTT
jgi:prephenate dehydrogenase